jgi:PTH2 family peptidyl-tRNA hydrolase
LTWLEGAFTKVVLKSESEQELRDLYQKAKDLKIPCSLIEDNGLTQFHGVKTLTAIAIGPDDKSIINEITGHLKLL